MKEDTHGQIRSFMKAVFGWTRDKEKEKFSTRMPVDMKGTGETISAKDKECSFRTTLLSGFSIDFFKLSFLLFNFDCLK